MPIIIICYCRATQNGGRRAVEHVRYSSAEDGAERAELAALLSAFAPELRDTVRDAPGDDPLTMLVHRQPMALPCQGHPGQ